MENERETSTGLSNRLKVYRDLLEKVSVTDFMGNPMDLNRGANQVIEKFNETLHNNRKVLLAGNGGSAAIVSHMQNDLTMGLGLQAHVFNESPLLTALSNDYNYEVAFEKITEQWAEPDDLFIGVSSSGQSENILRAVQAAQECNCPVVTFTGFSENNKLRTQGIVNFYVPAEEYGFVEATHQALTHFITDEAIQRRGGKAVD